MSKETELLTEGLSKGYAGKTKIETVVRGGFKFKQSRYVDESTGGIYHDEWLSARTGGGQELAVIGEEKVTRLYAGGVISPDQLEKLGITKKDVIGYLIRKVGELGNKTRLFEDCTPAPDGDWQYVYKVTDKIESVGLTRALETINYKGVQVFVHGFEICPIRE
ncbi:hypothetical protein HYU90_02010 [Candidatus Collierbacteria bacterium]|nr:hypothetical protein [Candidatus Collierbacteria bacterium]